MTDELERLGSALRAGAPPADEAARRRDIDAAMAAYDREFAPGSQGSLAAMRPTPRSAPFWRGLLGRESMTTRPSRGLFGGRTLAGATLVIGLVVAGGAAKYMYDQFRMMEARYQSALTQEPVETVMIAVAAKELRYGDALTPDAVRLVEWPTAAAPDSGFNTVDELFRDDSERTVLMTTFAGEPILRQKVTGFGEEPTIEALLSDGMRAHTLPVDTQSSMAGFLRPGSQIDIYLTYGSGSGLKTRLLMEAAQIIAVDQTTDPDEYAARVTRTVTLEVTPTDSQRLVLAERIGKLSFNLRGLGNEMNLARAEDTEISVEDLLGVEPRRSETVVVRRGTRNSEQILEREVARSGDGDASSPPAAASRPAEPRTAGRRVWEHRSAPPATAESSIRPPVEPPSRERYPDYSDNPIKIVEAEPVSTFSIDVDTASYAVVRSSIRAGRMPPRDAVRVEEMINYFPYDYPAPETTEEPFRASVEVFPSPWRPTNRLVHIGIKGYDLAPGERPRANLVFLVDTSGSMNDADKLPLLVRSLRLLLPELHPDDTVAIVAYAGSAGVVLEPTPARERGEILGALGRLRAGGSTAGGAGLALAYSLAEENLDDARVNRVILATDGDFNVGVSDPERLKEFVAEKRDTGVGLSVLGFGRGNYNDSLMQALAQNGDGNAAYIDSLAEAQKVMVEETASTLFTIARDVKIQVEFNPATVSEYRLIGYETRALRREDFNDDKVDAGEIGAGHTVTAIYEITPVGAPASVDPLRYGAAEEEAAAPAAASTAEYGFLKIRYKLPDETASRLITRPIAVAEALGEIEAASTEAQFATAVAAFGQILRGGARTGAFDYDDVIALSQRGRGPDLYGYRAEFTRLVRLAKSVATTSRSEVEPVVRGGRVVDDGTDR